MISPCLFDVFSPIGGYLICGLDVEGDIKDGDWLLVRVHRRNVYKGSGRKGHIPTCKWGWSIVKEHGHDYLIPQVGQEEEGSGRNQCDGTETEYPTFFLLNFIPSAYSNFPCNLSQ